MMRGFWALLNVVRFLILLIRGVEWGILRHGEGVEDSGSQL